MASGEIAAPITIQHGSRMQGYSMPGGAEPARASNAVRASASPAKAVYPPAFTNGSKRTMPPQYLLGVDIGTYESRAFDHDTRRNHRR